jgi:hypothetical protein
VNRDTLQIILAVIVIIVCVIMLLGCGSISVQSPVVATPTMKGARDVTKATVDFLCPEPVVTDPRGSFEAGFFDRWMKNRVATELSPQDAADIESFKLVCNKPLDDRTDYDYGTQAGGAIDRITMMMLPYMGKDFFSIMSALGLVIK